MNKQSDSKKSKLLLSLLISSILLFSISMAFADDVSATNHTVTNNIQNAINYAIPGDEVHLDEGVTYKGSGNVSLIINESITLRGLGTGATIDGGNNNRIISSIKTGVTLTLININFVNGADNNEAGAIYNGNTATLNIYDCNFTNNNVNVFLDRAQGGAIYNNGQLYIENCNFAKNRANSGALNGGQGGAIYTTGSSSSLTIIGSKFDSNDAYGGSSGSQNTDGGAIYINSGTVSINSSIFTSNTGVKGGAIFNNGQLTILDSTFDSNRAYEAGPGYAGKGGAIYSKNNMEITGSVFSNNKAEGPDSWIGLDHAQGGAIYVAAGANRIQYSIIYNNTVSYNSNNNGADLYNNNGGILGQYGDFWADNNFWGTNNPNIQNRIGGWKTSQLPSSYYTVKIITDQANNTLLIGDELPYYLAIYKNGTTDDTDSDLLPDLLVRLNYTAQNAMHCQQTKEIGNYNAYNYDDETTILGETSTIDVNFIGTGIKLDTLIYTTTQYRAFIEDLKVTYINDPIYGQQTKINGTIKNKFGDLITAGTVTLEIFGVTLVLDSNTFNGGIFEFIINNTYTGRHTAKISYIDDNSNSAKDKYRHIRISRSDLEIKLNETNGTYGNTGIINVTVIGDIYYGDEIRVGLFVNGVRIGDWITINPDGTFQFEILDCNESFDYLILLDSNSRRHYDLDKTTGKFRLDPAKLTITTTVSGGIAGKDGWVNGTVSGLVGDDIVTLKTTINGKEYTFTVSKSNPNFSIYVEEVNFATQSYEVIITDEGKGSYVLDFKNQFVVKVEEKIAPDHNEDPIDDKSGDDGTGDDDGTDGTDDGTDDTGNDSLLGENLDDTKNTSANAATKETGIPILAILLVLLSSLLVLGRKK